MIEPKVGMPVLLKGRYNADDKTQPEFGFIASVINERCVNIAGFDKWGLPFAAHAIPLMQDDGKWVPDYCAYFPGMEVPVTAAEPIVESPPADLPIEDHAPE